MLRSASPLRGSRRIRGLRKTDDGLVVDLNHNVIPHDEGMTREGRNDYWKGPASGTFGTRDILETGLGRTWTRATGGDEGRIEHSIYGSDELRQDQDRFKGAGWELDVGPGGGSS